MKKLMKILCALTLMIPVISSAQLTGAQMAASQDSQRQQPAICTPYAVQAPCAPCENGSGNMMCKTTTATCTEGGVAPTVVVSADYNRASCSVALPDTSTPTCSQQPEGCTGSSVRSGGCPAGKYWVNPPNRKSPFYSSLIAVCVPICPIGTVLSYTTAPPSCISIVCPGNQVLSGGVCGCPAELPLFDGTTCSAPPAPVPMPVPVPVPPPPPPPPPSPFCAGPPPASDIVGCAAQSGGQWAGTPYSVTPYTCSGSSWVLGSTTVINNCVCANGNPAGTADCMACPAGTLGAYPACMCTNGATDPFDSCTTCPPDSSMILGSCKKNGAPPSLLGKMNGYSNANAYWYSWQQGIKMNMPNIAPLIAADGCTGGMPPKGVKITELKKSIADVSEVTYRWTCGGQEGVAYVYICGGHMTAFSPKIACW